MKKILFITNIPSPYRVKFFNFLSKHVNLDVIFERNFASDRNKMWFDKNIDFNYVILKSIKYGKDKSFSFGFIKYILKNYDHVFIGGYSSFTLALAMFTLKLLKIKFTLEVDGGFYKKQSFLLFHIKKILLNLPTFIFSTSNECDQYLLKYLKKSTKIIRYKFATLTNTELEYNFQYSKKFKTSDLKLFPKKRYKFLSIINDKYIKGLDILIDFLNSTSLIFDIDIINVSKTNPLLAKINERLKSHITIHDFIDNSKLKEFYSSSDFFIFPTRSDVWGIVVYESLSFGTPVISTNMSLAALHFINNFNGLLINTTLNNLFSNELEYKLSNFKFFDNLNCYNSIKSYSIESMVQDHLLHIKNL